MIDTNNPLPDGSEIEVYDQAAELAVFKTRLERLSAIPRYAALCGGIMLLIERGLLCYQLCQLRTHTRPAFVMNGDPRHALDIAEVSAGDGKDPAVYALLVRLIRKELAFWPGYYQGAPDLYCGILPSSPDFHAIKDDAALIQGWLKDGQE
jgi:hypothetical protein